MKFYIKLYIIIIEYFIKLNYFSASKLYITPTTNQIFNV